MARKRSEGGMGTAPRIRLRKEERRKIAAANVSFLPIFQNVLQFLHGFAPTVVGFQIVEVFVHKIKVSFFSSDFCSVEKPVFIADAFGI